VRHHFDAHFDAPLLESTPLVTWNPAVPQTPLPEISMEFGGAKHLSGTDFNPSFEQSLATMNEEVGDDTSTISTPKQAPQTISRLYILPDTPPPVKPVKSKRGRKPKSLTKPKLDPDAGMSYHQPSAITHTFLQCLRLYYSMTHTTSNRFWTHSPVQVPGLKSMKRFLAASE